MVQHLPENHLLAVVTFGSTRCAHANDDGDEAPAPLQIWQGPGVRRLQRPVRLLQRKQVSVLIIFLIFFL